ncbi:protein disulfide-isomerase precursor [Coemansia javaensis]|uniref:protein disulfide-isomerase n=1 Tax=Coemansia javaensis TaxID=2761396 RepID=A0A9W8LF11_9FUNG|nr:protein disulfide-isomerase precursor [Coemansia javaensis]
MRFAWSAAAALAAVAAVAAAADSSAVRALTTKDYKSWVAGQRLALVEFYAPWCVYCQALEPTYAMAAAALKPDGIPLAKVDCTAEEDLCDELEIPGFPTLMVVASGATVPYNGTREETGIVEYMRRHSRPPLPAVPPGGLAEATKADDVVAIGYFDAKAPEFAVLEAAARELRDECAFGYVADRALAKQQGVPVPGIAVYSSAGKDVDVYSGAPTVDGIRRFIRTRALPVLGELSSRTFGTYIRAGVPIGLVFYNSDEQRKDLESKLLPVARDYRQTVSMAFVDARIYSKHAKMLSLEPQWPAFAIQNVQQRTKFLFPQDKSVADADEIRRFVGAFAGGKLRPDFKSEPVPATNDGDVFQLVSTQFNEVVFDSSKDVLVLFYAPWCIHCKRMSPTYDELGKAMKGIEGLVIAKMDATANDVPSSDAALDVPGYPTIILVRAHDNRVVKYHGNRSLESFTSFIRQNAARPLPLPPAQSSAGDAAPPAATPAAAATPGAWHGGHHPAVHDRDTGFSPKETRHIEL